MNNVIYLHTRLKQAQQSEAHDPVSVADIVNEFHRVPVPEILVQVAYLGLTAAQIEQKPTEPLSIAEIQELLEAGVAVNNYITNFHTDEHQTDKRYLLRYIENLCERHNLNNHRSPGYGHDVIYSKTPLDHVVGAKFDNSLYLPPLKGYWAIVGKGSARD